MSNRRLGVMAIFWKVLAAFWIVMQLLSPAFVHGQHWDRRPAETGFDNRAYSPSAPEHSFWSSWAEWQPCTRTCGGGISSRIRYCQPRHRTRPDHCPGDTKQHRLCSTQPCPKELRDFRQQQCSTYNNRLISGRISRRWIPAQGHHGCDLKCRSMDHGTVYTFGKANDSTPCHQNGDHICLNGRCMEVGCDLILGSSLRLDACGVCGGRNDSCEQVRGSYVVGTNRGRRKVPEKGYEEVEVIPAGSTRIYVYDTSPQNYIALADSRRRIMVNGNRQISWPGSYPVAGTQVNYSRQWQTETFDIQGPTKEDLYLMLLVYDKKAAPVRYMYWKPSKEPIRPPQVPPRPHPGKADNSTVPGYPPKDSKREFKEKVQMELQKTEELLDAEFQHLLEVLSKARELWTRVEKLGYFVVQFKVARERMDNRLQPPSPPQRTPPYQPQPEPREGPGRNPEDFKLYGDPYAHRDPRHKNPKPGRNPGSSVNDPRNLVDSNHKENSSRDRSPGPSKHKYGKTSKGRCPPCKRINEKVKNFCESDFVVRARVLDLETVGSEIRYDLGIVESYKNTVYMSHREYVWSPSTLVPECWCPRLRRNQEYVLMGRFDRNYRRRESRLMITAQSYVRKALPKRDLEMKNLKKVASRKCKNE